MNNIARWDPFRDLANFQESMDRIFDHGISRPWRLLRPEGDADALPLDVYETDADVVVKASLPGVKMEDVEITVNQGTLTIRGESKDEHVDEGANYYRKERRFGAFQRSLALPVDVDADNADAVFGDGVLSLRLPKATEARSKSIPVKAK